MAGNQVQVPVIQTDNSDLTQIQQNINKVLRNFDDKTVEIQNVVARLFGLGDIIFSSLSLAQVQAIHGSGYIAANGQSSVGTAYAAFSKNNTVPTIALSGCNAFIKVN